MEENPEDGCLDDKGAEAVDNAGVGSVGDTGFKGEEGDEREDEGGANNDELSHDKERQQRLEATVAERIARQRANAAERRNFVRRAKTAAENSNTSLLLPRKYAAIKDETIAEILRGSFETISAHIDTNWDSEEDSDEESEDEADAKAYHFCERC